MTKKFTLVSLTFSAVAYEKSSKLKSTLTPSAQNLFYVIIEFAKALNLKTVKLYLVDDRLQDLKSDTCGFFQLYFYANLFLAITGSQILNNQKLTNTTREKLLKEVFTLNINESEKTVEELAQKM